MKLSTRSRYGLRALLDLAKHVDEGPLQIKSIADREDISSKYLEQLMAILKSAGLVRSVRGPKGGYMLAKKPEEIRLSDVFVTLEGPMTPVECVEHTDYCSRCTDCITRQVWIEIHQAIMTVLESTTLQDLVDRAKSKKKLDFQI
ncbi:Cysteine metabolism repressor [Anaerohalosphaera lusitana]|uniref:Cysteine metabolism repressor n=1 Tax=Anaerohalosphaera lusitana TaxID=1936003 RepID=A0A1U9NNX4_9BACT|nr:Rrf2 family transcriptional regulator [Anaerohalosphaera lusitana]AQT69599.1 Cysteine metabolism repressor [Anaerohalosphaera lusitana]